MHERKSLFQDAESVNKDAGEDIHGNDVSDNPGALARLSSFRRVKMEYCFAISYRRENLRQYELRASTESDCKAWIEAIREGSFNKLLLQKEELEQKHLHLLQIVESEKTAKWQYTQQCEELASEIKKLRAELCALKKEWRPTRPIGLGRAPSIISSGAPPSDVPVVQFSEDSAEMRKIKKVQSFFRGWLCRRRWKQIVEQYIKSPHAESMRKRNR
ncbi:hypothetical protein GE061_013403 [Apolygus lucorum]|uniref:PH domain-containing protein n=1 Tax=Apolygus lucorum TaxID=248454 RepID=A0A8S9XNX2_APOLU|nr:hypothetical protein GE061_013403 [Apolygus lucorum]